LQHLRYDKRPYLGISEDFSAGAAGAGAEGAGAAGFESLFLSAGISIPCVTPPVRAAPNNK
jgi:hypothetical protein